MRNKNILFFLFLLIFLTGCSLFNPGKEISERTSSEEIIVESQASLPVDLAVLLDQSGSMSGAMGQPATDPKNLRIDAVKYFVNNFSTKSDQKAPNKIGVINFGTSTPEQYLIPLADVYYQDQQVIDKLTSKIQPLNLGETNFINALKSAVSEFQVNNSFSQKRSSAVVIFTDGEPYDSRQLSLSSYFKEIKDYITQNIPSDCQIFVIGIDDKESTWSSTISYWKQIVPENRIFKINQMSDLQKTFNDVIRKIFQIPEVTPDIVGTTEKAFSVPPYLETLELHAFFSIKNTTLQVYDPESNMIDFKERVGCYEIDKGTYRLYLIFNPTPGQWKYKIVGGSGTVEIYKNYIPVKVNVMVPQSPWPVSKESKVIVKFARSNGAEVISNPKYPLRIVVSILDTSNNYLFSGILNKIGYSTYETENIFCLKQTGRYILRFEVAGGTEYSYSYTANMEVKELPYLKVLFPQNNSTIPLSNRVEIRVRLEKAGKNINPAVEFETNPLLLIRAQLAATPSIDTEQPSLEPEVIWLDPSTVQNNIFTCSLPVKDASMGRYTAYIALNGKSKSSGTYSDILILDFEMRHSLVQKTLLALKWLGVALFVLWVVQWILFRAQRRKKMKIVQVCIFSRDENGKEANILEKNLSGKGFLLIKLKSKKNIRQESKAKGYVYVYGEKDNVVFVYFSSIVKYILLSYFTALVGKKELTRGLESELTPNIYIRLI